MSAVEASTPAYPSGDVHEADLDTAAQGASGHLATARRTALNTGGAAAPYRIRASMAPQVEAPSASAGGAQAREILLFGQQPRRDRAIKPQMAKSPSRKKIGMRWLENGPHAVSPRERSHQSTLIARAHLIQRNRSHDLRADPRDLVPSIRCLPTSLCSMDAPSRRLINCSNFHWTINLYTLAPIIPATWMRPLWPRTSPRRQKSYRLDGSGYRETSRTESEHGA